MIQNKHPQHLAIAVDLGGTNTRVALVTASGTLRKRVVIPTPHPVPRKNLLAPIVRAINDLVRHAQPHSVIGVGLSVAGPLRAHGAFYFTAFRTTCDIVEPLRKACGLPIFLLNDTHAAALAVGRKEYPHTKNLAYITISTGIGVGAIVDGHVLAGHHGNAGELGHMPVYSPYTRGIHSWEHYVAGKRDVHKGLVRFYHKWATANNIAINARYSEPRHLFAAHDRGAPNLRGFMDEVGKINAQGVATVLFAYNPQVVVFGGSIAYHNYTTIMKGVRKHVRRDIITPLPRFVRTTLGDNAALYGAGYYALEQCDYTKTTA